MAVDTATAGHLEWLGYVQPTGIVVSVSALMEAQLHNESSRFIPLQQQLYSVLPQERGEVLPRLDNFAAFAEVVLDWRASDLEGPDATLTVAVPGYEDNLHPDYVVKDHGEPLLLIVRCETDFDKGAVVDELAWKATPQARFERLLRETGVGAGLLVSAVAIRLVYAPKGETSGFITFRIADMITVAGRPILGALHLLLSEQRLFSAPDGSRLTDLLVASRKHQSQVSNKLSGQVMSALFDLLRGFQAAHDATSFLAPVLEEDPNQVYAGLLTVLLRLVFIFYAEHRDLLSVDEIFVRNYSLGGLFERLREDEAQNPDTMGQRYGAWAQLLTLFRVIHGGARHAKLDIPGRKGYLFDPDRYPFLEGRPNREVQPAWDGIPRVPDGVVLKVLKALLLLEGERLSYRNLDVEQIGSVYEAMMGFELHLAKGVSIALKGKSRNSAAITINLEELLAVAPGKRGEWLSKNADTKLTGNADQALKDSGTVDSLLSALDRRIAKHVTEEKVPAGSMIFQPSAERRRSGSHYTPRSLTHPIVEAALAPVLKQLGENPTPAQILALKVCDPAMGSGAFLVEACRQLGDTLVSAWQRHGVRPDIPPDEDELNHARRTVAQRCLYGVDRNPMAVDLAKLSLWLATLARDHEFTFLDHALRHGDSLVGFSARQIAAFHWAPAAQAPLVQERIASDLLRAAEDRREILEAQEGTPYALLAQKLGRVEDRLTTDRNLGDVLVTAFFDRDKAKARETLRQTLLQTVDRAYGNKPDAEAGVELSKVGEEMRRRPKPLVPFHWELEFPEVFALDETLRPTRGFDVIVGNPPFAGKNTIIEANPDEYIEWLKVLHPKSHGNADLVAHFFRRAFNLLRFNGSFGLIATNTIAQGDTRFTGLTWLCKHGGTIYRAQKRYKWPGEAAVVVSVVHVIRGEIPGPFLLNGREVDLITAYLFYSGDHDGPRILQANAQRCFQGVTVDGQGFIFDDSSLDEGCWPMALARELVSRDKKNSEIIKPLIGWDEISNSPTHEPLRLVMDFGGRDESEAEGWPELLDMVRQRVLPVRLMIDRDAFGERWWQFTRRREQLSIAKAGLKFVLVCSAKATTHLSFARIRSEFVVSNAGNVIVSQGNADFACLQSRAHEIWARFQGSSVKDDLTYTSADCFETFPFPPGFEANAELEQAGQTYYDFRANLMVHNDEGLTKTYNRFHRPSEQSAEICELRRLHTAMDRAVLDAYGWNNVRPICDFFPEFEDEEDEDENLRPGRGRTKKYRYRWSDEVHDDVLARLLALNRESADAQEVPESTQGKSTKDSGTKKTKLQSQNPGLF